jgi:iron complex outermembrane recepter protein
MKISNSKARSGFIRGSSLTCIAWLVCFQPAFAQATQAEAQPTTQSDEAAASSDESDIIVTGTRLANGFSAPTPITVASADDLKAASPNNLADGLAQLPQFTSSNRTSVGVPSVAIGTTGQNLLNLRGLGFNRNLVLLDGQRIVSTNQIGSVDANVLPQAIVKRVETVTGGASAAYGSDAISGVVNFILDRKFEGLKAEANAGISTYGDLPTYLGQLSFGKSFMDGRLHVVVSGEYFNQDGLDGDRPTGRDWYDRPVGRIANPNFSATLNPATGLPINGPRFFLANDIRSSVGAPGGVIVGASGVLTTGPLAYTRFLPGGATTTYNPGTFTGSAFQSGGDGGRVNASLVPNQERYNVFAGINYEFSDSLSMHADFIHARTHIRLRPSQERQT